MPLLNSMGILRNMSLNVSVTPIVGQQWISTFSSAYYTRGLTVSSTGESYFNSPGSFGVTKLSTSGSKVFSKQTGGTGYFGVYAVVICIDSSGNSYVGGGDSTSPGEFPLVMKYGPTGNIIWQNSYNIALFRDIVSMIVVPTGDLFILSGSAGGGSPVNGYGPYVLFRVDSNTGNIINQRLVLQSATSAPTDLYIDTVNNKLVITGTDYQTTQQIVIGSYNFTNTDSPLLSYQSSTVDDYETNFGGNYVTNTVTDGTYFYLTAYRVISGITRGVYMKVDSSGYCYYSYEINLPTKVNLRGIAIDDNGYIYTTGYNNSGGTFLFKIRCTDGAIIWVKQNNFTTSSITYVDGFLYLLTYRNVSGTTYQAIMKINSDGSLPNGTYGTYWSFQSPSTPTLTSLLPQTTGTTAGSPSVTTYTQATASATVSNSGLTISTTNIP